MNLIAASLTAMILSYVYKENMFFRIAEHTFIGTSSGYFGALAVGVILNSGVNPLLKGKVILIIPIILGVLLITRYIPNVRWMSLWPTSLLVGVGTALAIRGAIRPSLVDQIVATTKPLFVANNSYDSINNILMLVMVVGTLSYFIFTKEHKGALGSVAYIGRITILAALGSSFGNTVMTRMTLLLGRVQFMLGDPAWYVIPVAFAVIILSIIRDRTK